MAENINSENPHKESSATEEKAVTYTGLQRYHHQVCDVLGLENDTMKYSYTKGEGFDDDNHDITAPENVKEAVDELYDKTLIMCDAAKKFYETEYHSKFGQTNGKPTLTLTLDPKELDFKGSGDTTVKVTATFVPGDSVVKYVDANGVAHEGVHKTNSFINTGTDVSPVYINDFRGSLGKTYSEDADKQLTWTLKTNTATKVVYETTYTFNALDTTHVDAEGNITYTNIEDNLPSFNCSGSVTQTQWIGAVEPTKTGTPTSHDLSDNKTVVMNAAGTWAFQNFDEKPTAKFFNDNYKDSFATCGQDVQTVTTSTTELNGGKYGVKYIYIITRNSSLTVKTTAGVSQIVAEGSIDTVAGKWYIFHSNNKQSGNLNSLKVTNA